MRNRHDDGQVIELEKIFENANKSFLRKNTMLFETRVSERTLCGALMIELHEALKKTKFSDYFVDVEYNRNIGGTLKTLKKTIRGLDEKIVTINCDLIVHSRGQNILCDNLIALEMKKSTGTLKREFEEELHAKIEVDNLLAIGEIYFPWGKRPCHQICLYYNVHLVDDNIPLDGVFHGYDELDNERIDLDFCWVSLEELKKGTKVYPLELIPYIIEPRKEMVHFVSKQI